MAILYGNTKTALALTANGDKDAFACQIKD
jgi:hypothetical protein